MPGNSTPAELNQTIDFEGAAVLLLPHHLMALSLSKLSDSAKVIDPFYLMSKG